MVLGEGAMVTEWSPELTLNHDLLDSQHVRLFRLLDVASAAVNRFGEALAEHVAAETRMMEETLYPERNRHRTSHELLLSDVARVQAGLASSGPTPRLLEVVRVHMPEWLRFHTRVNDGPLGAYLARRGHNPTPVEGPGGKKDAPHKPS
jgi:hemerythrin-like metal-binding protein